MYVYNHMYVYKHMHTLYIHIYVQLGSQQIQNLRKKMTTENMDYFWNIFNRKKQNVNIGHPRMVNNCLSAEENTGSPDEVHNR